MIRLHSKTKINDTENQSGIQYNADNPQYSVDFLRVESVQKNSQNKKQYFADESKKIDIPLVLTAIVLSIIGLVFIFSASSYSAELQYGDSFHYVKTQAVALVLGVFFMLAISFLDLSKLQKFKLPIYVVSLVILALVFIPGFGVEIYGAKRWLNLGFFTIQPSEYAKFGMIIFIAGFMAKRGVDRIPTLGIVLLSGGLICLLLVLEPNMSITICVAVVLFLMLFFGGAKPLHLILLFVPAVLGGIALVVAEPYRVQRLLAYVNPWASPLEEGYQLIQSYYSLGAGGMFGIGLGNSRQKFLFLPFAESDFILSIIGEETGLVGCSIIIALFLVIIIKGIMIALRARDRFSAYLAAGVTSMIAIQSLVNIAVVCGAIPPTGLPLPFISAGGSSLVAYLCSIGLLLSVSRCSVRSLSHANQIIDITHKNFSLHNM
ncbi:MAG: putative lipid II flippase FtsW [Clostridia bacterium]|nr:putative lipid II flippase FtsW [Clostridia bacterium]